MTIEKALAQTELKTESPLAEKDQQGLATEQQRKLAAVALEKWHRLNEKVKLSIKNKEK